MYLKKKDSREIEILLQNMENAAAETVTTDDGAVCWRSIKSYKWNFLRK